MNIYQKLNTIKEKLAYIQKDKKVDSYMAVTHDAVTRETRDLFIEQKVLIVPVELESKVELTGTTTGKGVPYIRLESTYRVDFINCDEPAEVVSVQLSAHALDHGDKAPGKAHSYVVKYAILKVLQIETGEEEEGRAEQTAAKETKTRLPALTDDQAAKEYQKWMEIKSLLVDDNGDEITERVNEEWFKLASNVRTAIKKHGTAIKAASELDTAATNHMKNI